MTTHNWHTAHVVVVLGKSGLVTEKFEQVDVEEGNFLSCWYNGKFKQIAKSKVSRVYININVCGKNSTITCWENPDQSLTREEALAIACKAGLEIEVAYEMDHNGCSPEEALREWDI